MKNLLKIACEKVAAAVKENRKRKIEFLYVQTYWEQYRLITPKMTMLPEFIFEEQRQKLAAEEATKKVLKIVKEDKVNVCYRAKLNELKNNRG